ncbi:hypothetical protein [Halovenus rubra]|nr:hypothetical protein [Halovenus rubra]
MTPEKNKDYITCTSDTTGRWKIGIRSSANSITDTVDELTTVVTKLWSALQQLCRVKQCVFAVWVYDQNVTLEDALTLNVKEEEVYHEHLKNDNDISSKLVRHAFETVANDNKYARITHLQSEEIELCLRLQSGDSQISKSDTEFYKNQVHDEIVDEEPAFQPLAITVDYTRSEDEESEKVNTVEIKFTSMSDIWFADTEQGRVNRHRLVTVLDEVQQQFDVMSVLPNQGNQWN